MGQLVTTLYLGPWSTDRMVKTDINADYRTYGNEGDVDYVIDGNGEYQPSNYDEMEESNCDEMEETRVRRRKHSKVKPF